MNIDQIFGLVGKLGVSPAKLLEGLKPYLLSLKDPLFEAVEKHEKERGNKVVYILYNETDLHGKSTGRLIAQFNDVKEGGLHPFAEYPFEQLILNLLTPSDDKQPKELSEPK